MKTKTLAEHFVDALGSVVADPSEKLAYFGAFILGWAAHESELEKELDDANKALYKSAEEWVSVINHEREGWNQSYHDARAEYVKLCQRIASDGCGYYPLGDNRCECFYCGVTIFSEDASADHKPDCIWAEAKLTTANVPIEVRKED